MVTLRASAEVKGWLSAVFFIALKALLGTPVDTARKVNRQIGAAYRRRISHPKTRQRILQNVKIGGVPNFLVGTGH